MITMPALDHTWQDLRFAVRTLGKNRGITAIAVFSLALGIGANTAIFSLIDTVLVKSLPVQNPQELVILTDPSANGVSIGAQGGTRSLLSYGEYEHIRDGQQVFSDMYASQSYADRISASIDGGAPEDVHARLVSGTYFHVLGVQPVIGRIFTQADDRAPHDAPYAVISYRFWDRRFSRSADVLGKVITLGKASLKVIGVGPPGFFGETVGDAPDLWIPMMMQPDVQPGREWLHDDERAIMRVMWLQVMGRLKPGVTLKQAQANVSVVFHQMLNSYQVPGLTAEQRRNQLDQKLELHPGGRGASELRDSYAQPLYVLMTIVGLVLLIACANIANLLLARAAGRQKEIAVRLALGAGRMRLARQLLTESLLLAAAGGALGVLLASWGSGILVRMVARGSDSMVLNVHPDARVLAFTAGLALLTGLLFGLAPALRASRVPLASTLKENSRGVTGGGRVSLGKVLVVAQIALSLLLLVGSGLFIRTLRNLQNVQLGFPREKLLVVGVDALTAGYKGPAASDLYNRLLDSIRAIPGVKSATYSQNGLFTGSDSGTGLYVEGYTPPKNGRAGASFDQVGPDFFASLGVPLLRGREITRQDTAGSTPVCVINQTMANDFFANRDPLGKHIKDLFPGSHAEYEIVGVAPDIRSTALRGKVQRRFFVPVQHSMGGDVSFVNYVIRTAAEPGSVLSAVRRTIRDTDRSIPITNADSFDELIDRRIQTERVIAQLSAFFGLLALLLASVGLYGVLSYAVARRTNEIGIRIAVGAGQRTVIWMILKETLLLVLIGAVAGGAAAVAMAKLVASRMFGVTPGDPATMAVAAAVLAVVALLAAVVPARRAARVDPMIALRVE